MTNEITRTSEAVTNANIAAHNSLTTNVHGVDNTSLLATISTGTYTGDNTVNRAIPHGLGVKPKIVSIVVIGHGTYFKIIKDTEINALDHVTSTVNAVTAKNSTNFYVGNAGSYPYSANATTYTYYWTAIG